MAFSYYAVTDTIFKIFFQSCCYEVVKNDKKSFVRSKLLIVYCIGILAVIFWLHYETGFLNNMFLEFTSIVYFAFLILSIVISIIKDVEYCEMLELIKKTKTELTSEAQSKKINYPIIAWILVMLLFYFYPLLTGLQSFYYYFVHGIPTAVPLSLHLVMHTVSFGKLVFIIDEFTDLSKEINKQTKEHILQPVMMKKLCIAQSDLEEMFVNLNEMLNPTLFVNLAVNFFCVFLQPYFIFDSLVTIPLLWTTIFNVKFLSEFIKLCLFSYVFQKLNSAISEWWEIVENTPGSPYSLLEMDRRGIVPHHKKGLHINVYNMFEVNTNYARGVLLTTMGYAFLIIQSAPSFERATKQQA